MKNGYEIREDEIIIELNDGQVTVIDRADLPTVAAVDSVYAVWDKTTQSYYATCYINGTQVKLHRLIMQPPDDMHVDHINRNTLYNRRKNLRIVTPSVNMHNQRKRKDNTSGFKGVSYVKHCKKYRARIQINGKYVYLGMFNSAKQAAEAVEAVRGDYLKGVVM